MEDGLSPTYYFAFGSNMKLSEMSASVPEALDAGKARLPDYRLRFSRRSVRRQAGVADVVPSLGLTVWGRLYKLPDGVDLGGLDRREGVSAGAYRRQAVVVRQGADDVPAFTYVVVAKEEFEQVPDNEYLSLIRVGADEAKLPAEYRQFLEQIADEAAAAAENPETFRAGLLVVPTSNQTGRGKGPVAIVPWSTRRRQRFATYGVADAHGRSVLVRLRGSRSVPESALLLDQAARAFHTHRKSEAYGYRASLGVLSKWRLWTGVSPRVTLLRVSRPAISDAEKQIAVVHEKPLELVGVAQGGHLRIAAASRASGGTSKWRIRKAHFRAFSGTARDLAHVGRPDYPTEDEVCLDLESRERLGVQLGDPVWVSASARHLLVERLVYYAITVALGVLAIKPLADGIGATAGHSSLISILSTLILVLAVATLELRQRIG